MLDILTWSRLTEIQREAALSRAAGSDAKVTDAMRAIVDDVRQRGDQAVREVRAKFDKFDAPIEPVAPRLMKEALESLSPSLLKALETSIANLTAFHKAQIPAPIKIETQPGVVCELFWRPIERVGLYIPAGTASLFSTLLMCAVPSAIAGNKLRYLCSPPRPDGTVDPTILAAAALCGIEMVFPVGGPAAIAAMAFGTKSFPKVDKIFGPGNSFVTAAKQIVSEDPGGAAIDMPAGPSEVMVIADAKANPEWVAADLLAQAEHGPDSQVLLLTDSETLAQAVSDELTQQLRTLPRAEVTRKALRYGRLIVTTDLDEALAIEERYAPEHLIIQGAEGASWPAEMAARAFNAASIFVGPFSPETAGDYASGTNHVLPTYGYARAYGSLSLLSFMKSQSVQTLSREGLEALAPTLITMAQAESLEAHAQAVIRRRA